MRINNESCFKIFKKYLSSYRHIFHKRSFEVFLLIIISIIVMRYAKNAIYKVYLQKVYI